MNTSMTLGKDPEGRIVPVVIEHNEDGKSQARVLPYDLSEAFWNTLFSVVPPDGRFKQVTIKPGLTVDIQISIVGTPGASITDPDAPLVFQAPDRLPLEL